MHQVHNGPGVQVGSNLGVNNSDAIVTINRGGSWSGIGQSIDTRCVDMLSGSYVEFSAWIRLTNKDGTPATNINPDVSWWYRKSPQLVLHTKNYRDETTKAHIYNREMSDMARIARPYKSDGFNLVHSIFRLPSTLHLSIEIDNAPDNVQFHIDDVSMRPFQCTANNLVRNGDLEELDATKYWDTWGGITLGIATGYGNQGNAAIGSQRGHSSYGPSQQLNLDCGFEGEPITIVSNNTS